LRIQTAPYNRQASSSGARPIRSTSSSWIPLSPLMIERHQPATARIDASCRARLAQAAGIHFLGNAG
jgi:hypothetical protein